MCRDYYPDYQQPAGSKTMLFQEAIDAAIKGNYITRNAWDAIGEYCIFLPGMVALWKITTKPQPSANNWVPLLADFLADDWKLVEKNIDRNVTLPEIPLPQ